MSELSLINKVFTQNRFNNLIEVKVDKEVIYKN